MLCSRLCAPWGFPEHRFTADSILKGRGKGRLLLPEHGLETWDKGRRRNLVEVEFPFPLSCTMRPRVPCAAWTPLSLLSSARGQGHAPGGLGGKWAKAEASLLLCAFGTEGWHQQRPLVPQAVAEEAGETGQEQKGLSDTGTIKWPLWVSKMRTWKHFCLFVYL